MFSLLSLVKLNESRRLVIILDNVILPILLILLKSNMFEIYFIRQSFNNPDNSFLGYILLLLLIRKNVIFILILVF